MVLLIRYNMRKYVTLSIFISSLLLICVGVPFLAFSQTNQLSRKWANTFTLSEPITIMTSSSDATEFGFDNRYLGYFTILQIKPDLFYMYYECCGTNRNVNNHLAFAYSTDGMNWVKSYPEGISHTVYDDQNQLIENTNLIFYKDIREFDVVKVLDYDYPFRMIANECVNQDKFTNDTQLCMWKSKDGVNFVDKVVLLTSKHDTQPSVIVRGNMMKIYLRLRGPQKISERHIGYMYVDLEGTMIAPPTLLSDDLYYTSAASILDESREILFPTYFDQKHPEENHFEACVVENNILHKLDVDMSILSRGDDKWGMICSHIITINHSQYIAYQQTNFDHTGATKANVKKAELRLSKISFKTEGLPCPPDPR